MRHPNKTEIMDLLEELGVEMETYENPEIIVPKDISESYEKPMLEIVMERLDKFGREVDPAYRTIKEQEEEEWYANTSD